MSKIYKNMIKECLSNINLMNNIVIPNQKKGFSHKQIKAKISLIDDEEIFFKYKPNHVKFSTNIKLNSLAKDDILDKKLHQVDDTYSIKSHHNIYNFTNEISQPKEKLRYKLIVKKINAKGYKSSNNVLIHSSKLDNKYKLERKFRSKDEFLPIKGKF